MQALLSVFGLPSVPIRWVVRAMVLASGLLLARFGELGALEGITGSWKALVWIAATARSAGPGTVEPVGTGGRAPGVSGPRAGCALCHRRAEHAPAIRSALVVVMGRATSVRPPTVAPAGSPWS